MLPFNDVSATSHSLISSAQNPVACVRRENDVTTPMAPELGLFLDECFYTAYNKKFSNSHEEITQKGYEELIRKFKHDVIYPHIATTEAMDGTMALWLHCLNDRHYPYFVTYRESAKV